jgi:hypothetical protein
MNSMSEGILAAHTTATKLEKDLNEKYLKCLSVVVVEII